MAEKEISEESQLEQQRIGAERVQKKMGDLAIAFMIRRLQKGRTVIHVSEKDEGGNSGRLSIEDLQGPQST